MIFFSFRKEKTRSYFVGSAIALAFAALGVGLGLGLGTGMGLEQGLLLASAIGCGAGVLLTIIYYIIAEARRFYIDNEPRSQRVSERDVVPKKEDGGRSRYRRKREHLTIMQWYFKDIINWGADRMDKYKFKEDMSLTARRILYPGKITDDLSGVAYERGAPYREYLTNTLGTFVCESTGRAKNTLRDLSAKQSKDFDGARLRCANFLVILRRIPIALLTGSRLLLSLVILTFPALWLAGSGMVITLALLAIMFGGLLWPIPVCLIIAGILGTFLVTFRELDEKLDKI